MNLWNDNGGWKIRGKESLLNWLMDEARREEHQMNFDFILVDDEHILDLNRQYLDHDYITDVIAFDLRDEGEEESIEFPLSEQEGFEDSAGEVYVCLDQAARQAEEYHTTVAEEVGRLLLHGLLHLMGWDDGTDEERSQMRTREDAGLKRAATDTGSLPWAVIKSAARNGGKE